MHESSRHKQPTVGIFTNQHCVLRTIVCHDNFTYDGLEEGEPPEGDIRETLLTAFINF